MHIKIQEINILTEKQNIFSLNDAYIFITMLNIKFFGHIKRSLSATINLHKGKYSSITATSDNI